ncbi:2-C-methyl-D-erythritol 4-phosphate cytidylyltransferase [Thermosulfurimonas marina]|uniref:2-C-methyl-D-erythritol 4-phosphate cytidylyltransferase n=1 Tax=Thermosulfurimonas marina TaxID=2047767 RepID=UPI00144A6029|nr:2-C-methyl-D-erythritol 4-phosphate cytidylyltransferase [Thermosulfurimonas marina]
MAKVGAILAAAGRGVRFGAEVPKQFLELGGRPVFLWGLSALERHPRVEEIVVAVPPGWEERVRDWCGEFRKVSRVVAGGESRQASVRRAFEALSPGVEIVLVHDAARPLVSQEVISRVLGEIEKRGAALAALPVRDTVKRVSEEGRVLETLSREGLWLAQTPQGARRDWLAEAFRKAGREEFTDEAALLEAAGFPVFVVLGDPRNFKLTYPEDFSLLEAFGDLTRI